MAGPGQGGEGAFEEGTLGPIFERYAGRVGVRWFDAEAFSGRHSDVVLLEAEDPFAYYEVVFGIEDGFRQLDPAG